MPSSVQSMQLLDYIAFDLHMTSIAFDSHMTNMAYVLHMTNFAANF